MAAIVRFKINYNMMLMIISAVALSALLTSKIVHGHSHVECTNLENGKCLGYARYYDYNHSPTNANESRDRNYIVSAGTMTCPQQPLGDAKEYTDKFPMAQVRPGQNVTVQWPPRGHLAQPHSPVWIYCFQSTGKKDPVSEKDAGLRLLATMSYENCVGDDVSWAKCTGSFQLPQDWQPGVHSCQWVWELNGGQKYVDCFEYEVSAGEKISASSPTLSVSASSANVSDTESSVDLSSSALYQELCLTLVEACVTSQNADSICNAKLLEMCPLSVQPDPMLDQEYAPTISLATYDPTITTAPELTVVAATPVIITHGSHFHTA